MDNFDDDICDDCRKNEEEVFRKVKDYLWDNPGTNEDTLYKLFGVSHKTLMHWLRKGRLQISEDSPIKITCIKCGAVIKEGDLCDKCKKKQMDAAKALSETVNKNIKGTVVEKKDSNDKHRMRFLNQ
ncbi:MAG: hypothetical protein K6G03_09045 [Lachnospiraceae bacterium]|nr:hypothetical protein [Lachnospiraceae bacterium]